MAHFQNKHVIKITFIVVSLTIIIFVSTNLLNFNDRIKNNVFKTVLLIDQMIFKELEMDSTKDKLVFLAVGHTYNVATFDKKTRKETHPIVSEFIKKDMRNKITIILYILVISFKKQQLTAF